MHIFIEIVFIILVATLISSFMRLLKQPLIIGYILSGVIVGPYFLNLVESTEYMEFFSKFGIVILLFIIGLNLKPNIIREVGKASVLTGLWQIIITSILGFLLMQVLGFGIIASLYGAVALTLSSTIIILKLLSDKGDLNRLYGKISVGFLLIQDIFVMLVLLIVSILGPSNSGTGNSFEFTVLLLIKGIAFFVILYAISRYVLPKLMTFLASSQELLFLFSMTWGLGLAAVFYILGFSLEIGALVAGVALSSSPFSQEISSRMKPLRDFFILLFFVMLGSQLALFNTGNIIIPAIILSLFVLIGNPIIVIIIMDLLGHKSRTRFLAGLTVAQISEFSLILIMLGFSLGHINREIVSLITLVGIITIAGSTYLILYADKIYLYLRPFLRLMELRKKIEGKKEEDVEEQDMIIFGYDRVGYDFVNVAERMKIKYFVVDFNPNSIRRLEKNHIPSRFGDADDIDFLEEISVFKSKMIVSTIPEFKTNLNLVSFCHNHNPDIITIMVSHDIKDTQELYKHGASFVVMPHYLGAEYASKMIETHGIQKDAFEKEKKQHLIYLEKRQKLTE